MASSKKSEGWASTRLRVVWILALALLLVPRPAEAAGPSAAVSSSLSFTTGPDRPKSGLRRIILLHGLGDTPAGIAPLLRDLDVPAQVVALRGPLDWGRGAAWFLARARSTPPKELARVLARAADQLAARIARLPASGSASAPPLVVGFSQGGMLAFALAVRHPDTVGASFPIAGFLPEPLRPLAGAKAHVPVVALHGRGDRVIAFDAGRKTIQALVDAGFAAQMLAFGGVGHAISPPMRARLHAELKRHLEAPADP